MLSVPVDRNGVRLVTSRQTPHVQHNILNLLSSITGIIMISQVLLKISCVNLSRNSRIDPNVVAQLHDQSPAMARTELNGHAFGTAKSASHLRLNDIPHQLETFMATPPATPVAHDDSSWLDIGVLHVDCGDE